jgi:two-component system sensor histidine kinase/response regulator
MGATILVADDDAENRALVRAALEDEGYRVLLASSGEEAIETFACEHPECILLDVRMPVVDGPTTCNRIRALPGGQLVSIMFVTALHDVETFDRALASGGDDFLTKPFRPRELLVRVEALLKLARLAAERNELYVEIKRQRDVLQRLQLQKDQLISFLVHDLKNPVNAIELQAQLVLRDRGAGDRAHRAAAKIRDEGHSQLRMITTLLDITKADEGQLAPVRQHVDLRSLIAEVVEIMSVHAVAANVALAGDSTVPTLYADPDLIRRVLENLVENAIRYSPEGGEVRVTATSVDGGSELRVLDAGAGVPVDQRMRVFERFETGATTRANRGLGLAFCKLAVEAQGGRIWIEDASPGAAFCIWLPSAA